MASCIYSFIPRPHCSVVRTSSVASTKRQRSYRTYLLVSGMASLAWSGRSFKAVSRFSKGYWPALTFLAHMCPLPVEYLAQPQALLVLLHSLCSFPSVSLSFHLSSWICVNKIDSFTSVLVLVIMFTSCLNSISQSMWKGWWILK